MNHWIFAGLQKNKPKKSRGLLITESDFKKMNSIIEICRKAFGYHKKFKDRNRLAVDVKKAIVYFSCKYTRLTLKQIMPYVNLINHSSIIHLRDSISDLIETDKTYKSKIEQIENSILEL